MTLLCVDHKKFVRLLKLYISGEMSFILLKTI